MRRKETQKPPKKTILFYFFIFFIFIFLWSEKSIIADMIEWKTRSPLLLANREDIVLIHELLSLLLPI
jgi:hypothetical protein